MTLRQGPCLHCGGSGILNVETSTDPRAGLWVPSAATCHACPTGAAWREVGLE